MTISRRAALLGGAASVLATTTGRQAVAQTALSPQLAELYERAKPEGEVSIWGPSATTIGWIPDIFAERFRDIKVSFVGSEQAAARFITESRANRHTADLWFYSLGATLDIQSRGLLQKHDWASLGAKPEGIFFGGEVVAMNNHVSTPIFSRSLVKDDDVPRQYEALLDPRWKDNMVASSFLLPRMAAYLAIEWGLQRTQKWMRALIDDNRTMITTAPVSDLLFSGERRLAISESVGAARRMNNAGRNVGYRLMEIVPCTQFTLAVTKNTPHPNAARFLAAWLMTSEAKTLFSERAGLSDVRTDPNSPLSREIQAARLKPVFEDVNTMDQRADYYRQLSAIAKG
ncbi:ABC transporter substrate-binding protein [Bosea caraganae]|nr:substrate-binding domain-containing protein [Bosea caraganae]